ILAIESSCDDTAAAVLKDRQVLSNVVSSQLIHQKFGGVVPEVASRAHSEQILPVVEAALSSAGIDRKDLDMIACTQGPGLMGSLMVGFSFAKALAYALEVPFVGVHHMQAHVIAHFLEDPMPSFPFLCLTVSGGHTQIMMVESPLKMTQIGKTRDDAAGEAFDKAGKLMGLAYPAGPSIDKLAQHGKPIFELAKPNIEGLDFSFSGLKTSFLYFLRDSLKKDPQFIEKHKADLSASLQDRIVQILLEKLEMASDQTGIKQIAIAGGVSANSGLRNALTNMANRKNWQVYIPKLEYCTDNAAMIGVTAYYKYKADILAGLKDKPDPRLPWDAVI
ncbi:UNVERIFIED_CONTAM: hypothetical protein GTU68_064272, partial [Idotea baltica]|nr:hypothetical protein [Idotea baltica]